MTTTNVEVSEVVSPGTIVWVQALFDSEDSHFGVVTSKGFWEKHAGERAKNLFSNRVERGDLLLPVMIMNNNFDWSLHFVHLDGVVVFGNLLAQDESLEECLAFFKCFTQRDGSKYYAEFLRCVKFYLRFLVGGEEMSDHPQFRNNKRELERSFITSLRFYRIGNLN